MRQLLVGFGLAASFVLGCLAATLAPQTAVPPARSADTQRWEYECRQAVEGVTEMANELGAEGWELVASSSGATSRDLGLRMVWCFKRPL